MSFKPKALNKPEQSDDNVERKPFVVITPEDGLQAVQVGLLVNLGLHKKQPRFAKDSNGKREQDEEGKDKIIWPKAGKDLEQKVSAYVDLLTQTHDYGETIGVKNIRLPLHQVTRGVSDGINFVTVAPRSPDGDYIRGKPWLLAPASQWCKIANVTKMEDGSKVSETMLKADYKNNRLNDISLLLGKPFMADVEVKTTTKDSNTYVNTKIKSPVPLIKNMTVEPALLPAISISLDDEDLLEAKDELDGACKMDLIRLADLRKIVLAEDYEGSEMQKAVQERFDEKELVTKAKEIAEKILETDKDLQEILAMGKGDAPEKEEAAPVAKPAAKAVAPKKVEKPVETSSVEDIEDSPF